jgi:hypothetical protein
VEVTAAPPVTTRATARLLITGVDIAPAPSPAVAAEAVATVEVAVAADAVATVAVADVIVAATVLAEDAVAADAVAAVVAADAVVAAAVIAVAAAGAPSDARKTPPAEPPSTSGMITRASREPTSSTSSLMIEHLVQRERWLHSRARSRGVSPFLAYSPRRAIAQRHSPDALTSETWACNQAVRSPSLARYDNAATPFALRPRIGATSWGSIPSISVYQSTDCHRSGSERNARAVRL